MHQERTEWKLYAKYESYGLYSSLKGIFFFWRFFTCYYILSSIVSLLAFLDGFRKKKMWRENATEIYIDFWVFSVLFSYLILRSNFSRTRNKLEFSFFGRKCKCLHLQVHSTLYKKCDMLCPKLHVSPKSQLLILLHGYISIAYKHIFAK